MHVGPALPADAQTAKLLQPAQASLYHPARLAESAATLSANIGETPTPRKFSV